MKPVEAARVAIGVGLAIAACSSGSDQTAPSTATLEPDAAGVDGAPGGDGRRTVVVESWRADDADLWAAFVIPAFERAHPDIRLAYAPTEPVQFEADLEARREVGLAGHIVACRPFDRSVELFERGLLADIDDIVDMSAFSDASRTAWTTEGGVTFCVPVASVLHGFAYNVAMLAQLGLDAPVTEHDFFAMLEAVAADGRFVGLAIGGQEGWELSEAGLLNFGPVYWGGEPGRTALLAGEVEVGASGLGLAFEALARWEPYLPPDVKSLASHEARALFTSGGALVFPLGSWDLGLIAAESDFEVGVFPPYRLTASGGCVVTEEFDLGFGVVAGSERDPDVQTVLRWLASDDFAAAWAEAFPGFFSLHPSEPSPGLPAALEMQGWRDECARTIRLPTQSASSGPDNLRELLWAASVEVATGERSVDDVLAEISDSFDSENATQPVPTVYPAP